MPEIAEQGPAWSVRQGRGSPFIWKQMKCKGRKTGAEGGAGWLGPTEVIALNAPFGVCRDPLNWAQLPGGRRRNGAVTKLGGQGARGRSQGFLHARGLPRPQVPTPLRRVVLSAGLLEWSSAFPHNCSFPPAKTLHSSSRGVCHSRVVLRPWS